MLPAATPIEADINRCLPAFLHSTHFLLKVAAAESGESSLFGGSSETQTCWRSFQNCCRDVFLLRLERKNLHLKYRDPPLQLSVTACASHPRKKVIKGCLYSAHQPGSPCIIYRLVTVIKNSFLFIYLFIEIICWGWEVHGGSRVSCDPGPFHVKWDIPVVSLR